MQPLIGNPTPVEMKSFLLACCLCATSLLTSSQNIKLEKKGDVDVAFVYKDPFGYFDYPKERTFVMDLDQQYDREIQPGLLNVSSLALRVRVWAILENIATNPVFVYRLNMEGLTGQKHYVSFQQISKYPDLVRRYKAIRPTSVNAVVGMGLNPDDKFQYGAYYWFNITEKDLLISGSESTPFGTVPLSGTWGLKADIVYSDVKTEYWCRHPKDFKPSNAKQEVMMKFLSKATRANASAWTKVQTGTVRENYPPSNTYIRITWPGDAIDAIQELYFKYERGEEKPPSKEVEDAMAKKELDRYNGNDEWGTAFEDDLKDVETVNDYQKKIIALKSKNRTVTTFDADKYSRIDALSGTQFFVLTAKDNTKYIVDKRGNKQSIGSFQNFDRVSANQRGEITAEVNLSKEQFLAEDGGLGIVNDNKFYSTSSDASQAVQAAIARKRQAERDEWAKLSEAEKKRQMNTVSIVSSHRYYSIKIARYVTNSQLQTLSINEGYLIR